MSSEFLERKVVYAGDYVFREGEAGERAYVVQEGRIEIFKKVDEEIIVLGEIGKGGIFGEMALVDNQPRMASARSTTTTTLVVVPRQTFAEKLRHADPFLKALLGIFVRNIRNITTKAVTDSFRTHDQ